jgi:hypothetical protein
MDGQGPQLQGDGIDLWVDQHAKIVHRQDVLNDPGQMPWSSRVGLRVTARM